MRTKAALANIPRSARLTNRSSERSPTANTRIPLTLVTSFRRRIDRSLAAWPLASSLARRAHHVGIPKDDPCREAVPATHGWASGAEKHDILRHQLEDARKTARGGRLQPGGDEGTNRLLVTIHERRSSADRRVLVTAALSG